MTALSFPVWLHRHRLKEYSDLLGALGTNYTAAYSASPDYNNLRRDIVRVALEEHLLPHFAQEARAIKLAEGKQAVLRAVLDK